MTTPQHIAEAFSGHRFKETYDHLAADVAWVLIGAGTLRGRAQVIQACEQTTAELADTSTTFLRFLTIAGTHAVAVDAVGQYTTEDGSISTVSSCDIYEFNNGKVATITSYTVELDPTEGAAATMG